MHRKPGIFRSYWIAGYEGADHINGRKVSQCLNHANRHHCKINEDYAALKQFNIHSIRESVGWRLTELNQQFHWAALELKAAAAQKHGLQVIWTLMHYGWPQDTDPFSPKFVSRFARYCEAVARKLKTYSDEPPIYQPINEISFLSWAITNTGLIHPYSGSLNHRSYELKRQLVLAALRGTEAIWSVDPRARIIHTDPLIHIVANEAATEADHVEQARLAQQHIEYSFEAWDMLSGKLEPGLGGSPRHLDLLGLNYYHDNQWVHGTNERLPWHLQDTRRTSFSELAAKVWKRYERPIFIAETSHVGEGRGAWLDDIAAEIIKCEQQGVPIEGVCLYPIIDRPDWENPDHWHKSGLWDVINVTPPSLAYEQAITLKNDALEKLNFQRVLNEPYANRLRYWQSIFQSELYSPANSHQLSFSGAQTMPTLLVFSHLRWNFVYQRPQQLLSRLAEFYHIVFVEEPVNDPYDNYLERFTPCANVEVLRPHLNSEVNGFDDSYAPILNSLISEFMGQHKIKDFWLWFYTPLALPIAKDMPAQGVVYDCMDELSAFKNASPLLVKREDELFKVADIVFTGGPSLFESKLHKHQNIYCFTSSVDAAHYAPKNSASIKSLMNAPHKLCIAEAENAYPRLGYVGVIDERIDLPLISALAVSHPEWQIIMVGPVVKIDLDTLPNHSNIQWLGQKAYEELPDIIAEWDVCMMPFALNESTRYISPTKTLEYMAAERAIVCTNIKDVAQSYNHVVSIAETHEEYIFLCESLLAEPPLTRALRIEKMREIIARTSWDQSVAGMHQIISSYRRKIISLPSRKVESAKTSQQFTNYGAI